MSTSMPGLGRWISGSTCKFPLRCGSGRYPSHVGHEASPPLPPDSCGRIATGYCASSSLLNNAIILQLLLSVTCGPFLRPGNASDAFDEQRDNSKARCGASAVGVTRHLSAVEARSARRGELCIGKRGHIEWTRYCAVLLKRHPS